MSAPPPPPPAPAARSGAHATPLLSRRSVLAALGLAVVGAAGGVTAGVLHDRSGSSAAPPPQPTVLLAAAQAERELLAGLDAALVVAGSGTVAVLRRLRTDHAAHLAALTASVELIIGPPTASASAPSPSPSSSAHGPAPTMAGIAAAERAAATAAAHRAAALTGRDAALLASIAACEASHGELLR